MARGKKTDKPMVVAILNEDIEMVDVESLKPFPGNARQGDVAALCRIIETQGFHGFLLVNQAPGAYCRTILKGNHTWEAARRLGMIKVPVLWVSVDDQRAVEINISDNRASDLADYDSKSLLLQIEETIGLSGDEGDLLGIGFDAEAIAQLRIEAEAPVASPKRPSGKVRILVQCVCPGCGFGWTGFINEDAGITRVNQKGQRAEGNE